MKQETIDYIVSQEMPEIKRENYLTDACYEEDLIRYKDMLAYFKRGLDRGYKQYAAELLHDFNNRMQERAEKHFHNIDYYDDLIDIANGLEMDLDLRPQWKKQIKDEIVNELPVWKKCNDAIVTEVSENGFLNHHGYIISVKELFDKLPKEK